MVQLFKIHNTDIFQRTDNAASNKYGCLVKKRAVYADILSILPYTALSQIKLVILNM
jgi:hypothetical protein